LSMRFAITAFINMLKPADRYSVANCEENICE
jgi:hypothetical protein